MKRSKATGPRIRSMEELSTTIGISRPTLSKYFQDAASVRGSTRVRIESALESVNYVPNFFATRMNRKSTRLIGVIVPYLNDLFFTSLIQAIEETALRSDFTVIIQCAHGDPALEARAARNLLSMSADGVILAPIGETSSLNWIGRLKEELALVFVDSRFPDQFDDVDFVGTNNEQSVGLMVDYLCRSGDSPIFMKMPRINTNSVEREQAYAAHALKLGFEPEYISDGSELPVWEFEDYAFQIMDEHFSRGKFVERTIFCANDRLAIGVIRAANRHHLLIGNGGEKSRFRVAGHDDHPMSSFVHPALTTVSRNTRKIGETAVIQLIDQIERQSDHNSCGRITFDAQLRLRESA